MADRNSATLPNVSDKSTGDRRLTSDFAIRFPQRLRVEQRALGIDRLERGPCSPADIQQVSSGPVACAVAHFRSAVASAPSPARGSVEQLGGPNKSLSEPIGKTTWNSLLKMRGSDDRFPGTYREWERAIWR